MKSHQEKRKEVEALRKIKRFMEDEENLSKSSQKIMKSHQEKRKEVEA
jgi:V/A-type H+-transporting ATPase subunit D